VEVRGDCRKKTKRKRKSGKKNNAIRRKCNHRGFKRSRRVRREKQMSSVKKFKKEMERKKKGKNIRERRDLTHNQTAQANYRARGEQDTDNGKKNKFPGGGKKRGRRKIRRGGRKAMSKKGLKGRRWGRLKNKKTELSTRRKRRKTATPSRRGKGPESSGGGKRGPFANSSSKKHGEGN